jgi:hypothetical protein
MCLLNPTSCAPASPLLLPVLELTLPLCHRPFAYPCLCLPKALCSLYCLAPEVSDLSSFWDILSLGHVSRDVSVTL